MAHRNDTFVVIPKHIPDESDNSSAELLSNSFRETLTRAHIEALVHYADSREVDAPRYLLLRSFVRDIGAERIVDLINAYDIVNKCPNPKKAYKEHVQTMRHIESNDEFNSKNNTINGVNNRRGIRVTTCVRVATLILRYFRHELPFIAGASAPTKTEVSARRASASCRTQSDEITVTADEEPSFAGSDDDGDSSSAGLDEPLADLYIELTQSKLTPRERQGLESSFCDMIVSDIKLTNKNALASKYGHYTSAINSLLKKRETAHAAHRVVYNSQIVSLYGNAKHPQH